MQLTATLEIGTFERQPALFLIPSDPVLEALTCRGSKWYGSNLVCVASTEQAIHDAYDRFESAPLELELDKERDRLHVSFYGTRESFNLLCGEARPLHTRKCYVSTYDTIC